MSFKALLFGKRLATDEEEEEQIGTLSGVPVLGLDALGSASYGPEAALTVLLPLGTLGLHYVGPLMIAIIVLLIVVYLSYRQTIGAYPSGGGSYTVARENLGVTAGLIGAAALMLDYVLNVAVATSAGVGALVSAVPALLPYTLPLCLLILLLLTLLNLRGVRSAGLALMTPAYAFLACLLVVLGLGAWKTFTHDGAPPPVVQPPTTAATTEMATAWLLCHAFANGCTAMTGVEAVSNGVPAFRQPRTVRARRTLAILIGALVVLLAGIAFLCRAYQITATVPGQQGYQSIVSQVVAAVVGRGPFYYVTLSAVIAVLALSANTSFADFPRLCRILAADGFLPEPFVRRGRRLAFSHGIFVLTGLAGVLLVVFQGVTEGLIPLFAVGALLAFTMSQAGMVAHWRREGGPHARRRLVLNACGALATAATLVVVVVAKFTEGAWISAGLILATLALLRSTQHHHDRLAAETTAAGPLDLSPSPAPLVVVPVRRWDAVAQSGLRFALTLSSEVYAMQVLTGDRPTEDLRECWPDLVEKPARERGIAPPKLVVFRSRYRHLFRPLLRFIVSLARSHPGRQVAVVIPQVVEPRWYHYLLHNHTSAFLRMMLFFQGRQGLVIIEAPWYRSEVPEPDPG
ncbi:APC family permease [Chondromyces apiculatus]|uniref:Amino acid permease n=1 Tax=Chondromyces apiculatus DSM 436 TaxID=1192034 RepID=A0A017T3K8_9BACT|nr:APC family permease [Chondromyces apiculatus]EYF03131.1 Hypothetical protein CAP_6107 [Chondromyces apiculatus DSM 436]